MVCASWVQSISSIGLGGEDGRVEMTSFERSGEGEGDGQCKWCMGNGDTDRRVHDYERVHVPNTPYVKYMSPAGV